jgi:hypothetical protein
MRWCVRWLFRRPLTVAICSAIVVVVEIGLRKYFGLGLVMILLTEGQRVIATASFCWNLMPSRIDFVKPDPIVIDQSNFRVYSSVDVSLPARLRDLTHPDIPVLDSEGDLYAMIDRQLLRVANNLASETLNQSANHSEAPTPLGGTGIVTSEGTILAEDSASTLPQAIASYSKLVGDFGTKMRKFILRELTHATSAMLDVELYEQQAEKVHKAILNIDVGHDSSCQGREFFERIVNSWQLTPWLEDQVQHVKQSRANLAAMLLDLEHPSKQGTRLSVTVTSLTDNVPTWCFIFWPLIKPDSQYLHVLSNTVTFFKPCTGRAPWIAYGLRKESLAQHINDSTNFFTSTRNALEKADARLEEVHFTYGNDLDTLQRRINRNKEKNRECSTVVAEDEMAWLRTRVDLWRNTTLKLTKGVAWSVGKGSGMAWKDEPAFFKQNESSYWY